MILSLTKGFYGSVVDKSIVKFDGNKSWLFIAEACFNEEMCNYTI